jgi:hypothetical protein
MRDADIREALRTRIDAQFADDPDTLVVDELALVFEDARVDVAVVNGALYGFEIKSERDTLARLPQQAFAYSRVFDHVAIVTGPKHLASAAALVPEWWAIHAAEENGGTVAIVEHRAGVMNPSVDPIAIAQLLWRDEALEELQRRELGRGLSKKPRRELAEVLSRELALDELRDLVRNRLRSRSQWRTGASPA